MVEVTHPYARTDPDVLADPAPAHARLRAECPVHNATVDGRPLYSVSRAADVHRILISPREWSNTKGPGFSSNGAGDMQHDDPPASPFLWGRKALPARWDTGG